MLPINSYNQLKSIKQLQSIHQSCAIIFSFMLPSSKLYVIKLLGYTVYCGNFSFPCVNSAILEINFTDKFCELTIVIREHVKVI